MVTVGAYSVIAAAVDTDRATVLAAVMISPERFSSQVLPALTRIAPPGCAGPLLADIAAGWADAGRVIDGGSVRHCQSFSRDS